MKLKYGTTRATLLVGRYAIKFAFGGQWSHFLLGCINNLSERMWYRDTRSRKLCPNYVCLFGGLILIAARAESLAEIHESGWEVTSFNYKRFVNGDRHVKTYKHLVEDKLDSIGIYENRFVAIDYH